MFSRSSSSTLLASLVFCSYAAAQTQSLAIPQAQILQVVDESNSVTLIGNVHPLTLQATSSAPADLGTPMQHMMLTLQGTAAQEAALEKLIAAQNDPASPLYHQYLTPQSFAAQFGAAPADIAKVTSWLQSHGMQVEQVAAGNRTLVFSGTAAQVNDTFKTEIRSYNVGGVSHLANATDPKIPAALAAAVGGVVKLHDFRHASNISSKGLTAVKMTGAQWTSGSTHYLTPADYATIYDINPLYSAGINGTGQSIAVIARTDISLSDVQTFRSTFGLKANDPQFILTNSDPGVNGDNVETSLDTEWSGAVAPNATIKVIISSSGTSDGIDLSSLYAVNNNVAPIITLSYGSCEAAMGASENSFYNSLWKQAASQGQSVMVSSGDSGAAGCDYGSTAQYGQNINGLCSSPYSTCVGGTEFADTTNPGQYWLSANSATYGSAISYIPEGVWNESGTVSGGSGLWAGGGGASLIYSKPSWQTGPGVPADSKRDVPDVSLTAAGHDGYFIALEGGFYTVGGTSAAAPSFAGMVALVDQKIGAKQGLLNSTLYPLAIKQASGGAAVFHDVKTGNNSVPGATGFSAGVGYDLASGLGSIDANLFVSNWAGGNTTAASLALSASATSLNVIEGQTGQTTITSTPGGSLKAAIAFTVTGAPAGLTATMASASIASPGSGTDVLKVVASSTVAAGTYNLTVTGTGGGQTASVVIAVTVPVPSFALSATATSLSVAPASSASVNLSLTGQNGFSSAAALTLTGLPTGVTATFTPASITTTTASVLKLTVASTAVSGTATLTITGTSGSLKETTTVSLVISKPTLSITTGAATVTLSANSSESLIITETEASLSSSVALTVSGLPTGVTAAFAPATLTASGTSTVKFTSVSVTAGTYPLTITATGGGLTSTAKISLVVPSASFTLTPSTASVSVMQGNSGQLSVAVTPQNGFNSAVTMTVTGLPTGVTGTFSAAAASGYPLALKVATTTTPGSYPLTISGTGASITKTASVTLLVTAIPTCTLASNPASLSMMAGLSGTMQLSCGSPTGTFTGPLTVTVTGAPTGITAQLSAATLVPGSTVNLSVSSIVSMTGGTYNLSYSVSGSGFSKSLTLPVTIVAQNILTLTASQMEVVMKPGTSSPVTLTTVALGSFKSAIAFTTTLPTSVSGLTVTLSKTSLPSPGSGTVVATINAASSVPAGNYTVQIAAIGGTCNESVYLSVVVANGPGFTFTINTSAVTIAQGASGSVITSSGNYTGGFSGQMSVSMSGLPSGVSYQMTGANASNNLVNITWGFNAASYTVAGTYPVTITATGVGVTHSVAVQVTIAKAGQTH